MSKKYTAYELEQLMHQEYMQFTQEEIAMLASGEADQKLIYKADKALKKYEAWLLGPMKRKEAFRSMVTMEQYMQEVSAVNHSIIFLKDALIEAGVITQEQIDHVEHEYIAEIWDHLCDTCSFSQPECKGENITFGVDRFKDLTGELADKILQCDTYKPKQEGGETDERNGIQKTEGQGPDQAHEGGEQRDVSGQGV